MARDWGSIGEINSGPAMPPTATLGTRTLEQGVREGEAEEGPFVLSWIQGCRLPFQCGDVSRMQAGWETPVPCALSPPRERSNGGQAGRGRGQPTSLANHRDPRWPCPPRGLASLALLHCWLRAALDGAHRDCCQTPGVESQLLLPQTFVLQMQFRTCLRRDLGVSFQSEPAEVMGLCGDVCWEAAR